MLDDRRAEIVDYLNKGVSKRSVGTVKFNRILWIWRRHRSVHELRINNLGSGQGTEWTPNRLT